MTLAPTEQARFLRPPRLEGVEALHATFIDHRYAPHFHDAWTVAHVVRGAARFELHGHEHIAPAGSVFVIPPGAVHTGASAGRGGYTYRVLYLLDDRLAHSRDGDPPTVERTAIVIREQGLADALAQAHAILGSNGVALEQGEAVVRVARRLQELAGRSRVGQTAVHPAIAAARDYIHECWQEDFTLDELAHAVGLSPFHLAHQFRTQIGMPPSAYRRVLRIQAAQRLLKRGYPPARTAVECGFYDQAHLNRHFKQMTGTTPGHYARPATSMLVGSAPRCRS